MCVRVCVHANTCICACTFRMTWKTCWELVKFQSFRCKLKHWHITITGRLLQLFHNLQHCSCLPSTWHPWYVHIPATVNMSMGHLYMCMCVGIDVCTAYRLSIYNDIITCTKVWTFYCTFHGNCTIMERKMWSDYQAFTSIYRNKPGFPQKRIQIGSYLWKCLSMQFTERTVAINEFGKQKNGISTNFCLKCTSQLFLHQIKDINGTLFIPATVNCFIVHHSTLQGMPEGMPNF